MDDEYQAPKTAASVGQTAQGYLQKREGALKARLIVRRSSWRLPQSSPDADNTANTAFLDESRLQRWLCFLWAVPGAIAPGWQLMPRRWRFITRLRGEYLR
jgi:hypothetical protein